MRVFKGATADGRKELFAIVDGFRKSKACWCFPRNQAGKSCSLTYSNVVLAKLQKSPSAMRLSGVWAPLGDVFGEPCEQRRWFDNTGDTFNKLRKSG